MTEKSPARSAEDIDETVLSYAQIKALATGNPKIKEKMDLEIDINRLRTVFSGYQESKRHLQADISKNYPEKIQRLTVLIKGLKTDKVIADNSKTNEFKSMTVKGMIYTDKKEAGTALLNACRKVKAGEKNIPVGEYRGFMLSATYDTFSNQYVLNAKGNVSHYVELGSDIYGNIMRIDNTLNGIEKKIASNITSLEETKNRLEIAKTEVKKPFPQLDELREKENRLNELNREFAENKSGNEKTEEEFSQEYDDIAL